MSTQHNGLETSLLSFKLALNDFAIHISTIVNYYLLYLLADRFFKFDRLILTIFSPPSTSAILLTAAGTK